MDLYESTPRDAFKEIFKHMKSDDKFSLGFTCKDFYAMYLSLVATQQRVDIEIMGKIIKPNKLNLITIYKKDNKIYANPDYFNIVISKNETWYLNLKPNDLIPNSTNWFTYIFKYLKEKYKDASVLGFMEYIDGFTWNIYVSPAQTEYSCPAKDEYGEYKGQILDPIKYKEIKKYSDPDIVGFFFAIEQVYGENYDDDYIVSYEYHALTSITFIIPIYDSSIYKPISQYIEELISFRYLLESSLPSTLFANEFIEYLNGPGQTRVSDYMNPWFQKEGRQHYDYELLFD